jgi:hypothetical protein
LGQILRILATLCGCLLQRILQRWCSAIRSALEIGICHLEIMLARNSDAVTQPRTNNMRRVLGREFLLSRRSETMEQAGPGFEPGSPNNAEELRAEINIRVPVAGLGRRAKTVALRFHNQAGILRRPLVFQH